MVREDGTVIDLTCFSGTIEQDLKRRDLTINAIAYDLALGRLIDPLNGLGDIQKGILRSPGRYALADDPLRMLKAFRHFATLKAFVMDDGLLEAIADMGSRIHQAAPERIKYEMDLILLGPRCYEALRLLERTGLLFELFPALMALRDLDEAKRFDLETFGHTIEGFRHLRRFGRAYGRSADDLRPVAYALLFHDLGKAHTFSYDGKKKAVHFFHHEKRSQEIASEIMMRYRFSTQEARTVLALIANHMRIFLITQNESTDKAVRRLVYGVGDVTPLLIVHTLCDMYGSSGGRENPSTVRVSARCRDVYGAFLEWKKEPLLPLLTGHDLMAIGFSEGPLIGRALKAVRERQVAGEISEKAEALDVARSFLSPDAEATG
jgi:tRNA nucleotidyltransferase/poly(A) polymerase